jgi:hypothetical protein
MSPVRWLLDTYEIFVNFSLEKGDVKVMLALILVGQHKEKQSESLVEFWHT